MQALWTLPGSPGLAGTPQNPWGLDEVGQWQRCTGLDGFFHALLLLLVKSSRKSVLALGLKDSACQVT